MTPTEKSDHACVWPVLLLAVLMWAGFSWHFYGRELYGASLLLLLLGFPLTCIPFIAAAMIVVFLIGLVWKQ